MLLKGSYVLKRAKEYELAFYQIFAGKENQFAPRFYGSTSFQNNDYFLSEFVEGTDLRKCDRVRLKLALDALIAMQDKYWDHQADRNVGYNYEKALVSRQNRGHYLKAPLLEAVYERFLQQFRTIPRTLCHDDLLPFNVLVSQDRAVLIDWEYAGILPYPASLARLIAHGEEDENAFFYMTDSDRNFAVQYYYDKLIAQKGISYQEYRTALNYFLFYEYCEWVALGNQTSNTDTERYRRYVRLAKEAAVALNQ